MLTDKIWSFASLTLLAAVACQAAEPVVTDHMHLGVASCASSVCHGKLLPAAERNVALNEYRLWTQDDRHARAYRALQLPEAKRMAKYLNLPNAATAQVCLDCHADNIAAELRGPKFRLDDGVGCEACHGGSEQWIQSHAAKSSTHQGNLASGMYPLEQPLQRASRCLECHLGTKDRFATHMIMAAGHPRLAFELEAFTVSQPAHFIVDDDYVRRKGKIEKVNLWLAGQIENARRMLTLLQTPLFSSTAAYPEPAFYDCSSCHHPIQQYNWNAQRASVGLKPGTLRLQTSSLLILQAVTAALEPAKLSELTQLTDALIQAGQQDVVATRSAAASLLQWIKRCDALPQRNFSRAEIAKLRKALIESAAADRVADYGTAEQVSLGLESLSYSLGDFDNRKAALDSLYESIGESTSFSPQKFANAARAARQQF